MSSHAGRLSSVLTLTCGVILTGCASFAPDSHPPEMDMPSRYSAESASSSTSDDKQVFSSTVSVVPEWWRAYQSDQLNAWVDEGLKNNLSLESARHTLESVRQQAKAVAGDRLLPSVDVGGQASRQRALGLPNFGPTTNLYDVYAGQLTLSYTLDIFGAARNSVNQANAQVDIQEYRLAGARRALAANIVITALQASALDEQVKIVERQFAIAQEQVLLTEKAYQLGSASNANVLLAKQNAASLQLNLQPLRTQALQARHALALYLGRTPEQAPPAIPLSAYQLPPEVPVSLPSDLLRQRPDIQAAEGALRAASARVGVATANLFPGLSLSASVGSATFSGSQLFNAGTQIWSVGLSLLQPIFHGGALMAGRRAAIEDYEASLADYKQTVLNAFQNVADTLIALQNDAVALQAAQLASDSAEQLFRESTSRYQLGAVSYPETLSSEQRWQTARLDRTRSQTLRLIDTAALFQAMGEPLASAGQH